MYRFRSLIKYKARVRDVLRGHWKDEYVEYAKTESSQYRKEITDDCYVVLRKINPSLGGELNVQYQAVDFLYNVSEKDKARMRQPVKPHNP